MIERYRACASNMDAIKYILIPIFNMNKIKMNKKHEQDNREYRQDAIISKQQQYCQIGTTTGARIRTNRF